MADFAAIALFSTSWKWLLAVPMLQCTNRTAGVKNHALSGCQSNFGGGTDLSLPLRDASTKYRDRKFTRVVLVSDNES